MGAPRAKVARRIERDKRIERELKDMQRHPLYKQMMDEVRKVETVNAIIKFSFFALEYLEMKHGYKKNGDLDFINFLKGIMIDLIDDKDYFRAVHKYFTEERGIDVWETYGLEVYNEQDIFRELPEA